MHPYPPAPAVAHTPDSTRARARPRARGLTAVGAAALLAGVGLFAGASPALAHDELVGYTVETDTADGTARALTLRFSNEIMEVGTEIIVTGPDGADTSFADGAPTVAGRDVTQALDTPLPAGNLAVAWRVVSSDGHPISGALSLLVAADGTATVGAAPSVEEPEDEPAEGSAGGSAASDDGETGQDHEHAEAVTAQADTADGGSPASTTLIVAAVIIVSIGAAVALVIGSWRRRRALDEAAAQNSASGGAAATGTGTAGTHHTKNTNTSAGTAGTEEKN